MNSYISLETAAIFFLANLFYKRVSARSMSWLISFALAYSTCEERGPRIIKWKFLAHSGIQNPGPSAYEYLLSVPLLVEISIEYLNFDRGIPECVIKLYLCRVPRCRWTKMFCHVLQQLD